MAENILDKIINNKIKRIVNLKKTISLESLDKLINTNKSFINFKEKIENNIKETEIHKNSFQKIKKKFKKKYPKLSIELRIISLNSKVETFR